MHSPLLDALRDTAGGGFALATLVDVEGSGPLLPGATMTVRADGRTFGSVSGGCVEAAVYAECEQTLADGAARVLRYGISDDDALAAGLPCGGTIRVFVERVDRFPGRDALVAAVDGDRPAVAAVVVRGPAGAAGARLVCADGAVAGGTGDAALDRRIAALAAAAGDNATGRLLRTADRDVFAQVFAARPRLIVFGAVDFAAALARAGTFLGYRVTVCDARPVFATAERFPDADEVCVDRPDRYLRREIDAGRVDARTAVCALTHDRRFDIPALRLALEHPGIGYVGAMGSRRTHALRLRALREAGVPPAALGRLRSPIGLDLGARTPEETAISIVAELVARRYGGSGRPLSGTTGTVHPAASRSDGVSTSAPEARSAHGTASTARPAR